MVGLAVAGVHHFRGLSQKLVVLLLAFLRAPTLLALEGDRCDERDPQPYGRFGERLVPTDRHAADDLLRLEGREDHDGELDEQVVGPGGVPAELVEPMPGPRHDQAFFDAVHRSSPFSLRGRFSAYRQALKLKTQGALCPQTT